jgi:two-component system, LytTR family, sensor kinase
MKRLRKPKLSLSARLTGYHPLIFFMRVIMIGLIAVVILYLIVLIIGQPEKAFHPIPVKYFVVVVLLFVISGEIQIALDSILEKILPIPYKVRLRLAIQLVMGLAVMVIGFFVALGQINLDLLNEKTRSGVFLGLLLGFLFIEILANTLVMMRFSEKWLASQKQISEMKREKLWMDYNSLQDQLNPHFLFNNLSVLKSLIIYDQDTAVKFTEDFTDVYRYVLQSKDKQLIRYKDEVEFIHAYIRLHKERLGGGLDVSFINEPDSLDKMIAPLTLQLLVENAIKHNIAAPESPLKINIRANEKEVRVENNIQRRETSYSTKTGLTNLLKRYELLTKKKIRIASDEKLFVAEIPLI